MNRGLAITTVFITGISVTAIEISSARLVAPFFGSTIYVWGAAIGTALTALALGYWLGGKIIDRRPEKKLVGVVLFCSAISTTVIPWIYRGLLSGLQFWTRVYDLPVALASTIGIAALFFLPLMAMGMISPIVLRLSIKDVKSAGSWSGMLSGMATAGSILGTFLAAYASIPLLGTRLTILIAAGLLFSLSIPFMRWRYTLVGLLLVGLSAAISSSTPFINRAGILSSHESAYQLIQVIERDQTRYLLHDAAVGVQSIFIPGQPYSDSHYDAFGLLPYLAENGSRRRSVLMIGLAGGTIVRPYVQAMNGSFDFSITGVEIDPRVVKTARRFFDLDSLGTKIIVDDARFFLSGDKQRYDLIIIDAYTNEMVIPPMLATREFFQQVKDHLAGGGIMGINAAVLPNSRYYQKFINTIAAVFSDVRHAPFRPGASNYFIIAGAEVRFERLAVSLPPVLSEYWASAIQPMRRSEAGGEIYTDDRTDLDIRVRPLID